MEDFIFHFLQKTGYLWLPHTGYLTSYLRVEVTRGHQKKKTCWLVIGPMCKMLVSHLKCIYVDIIQRIMIETIKVLNFTKDITLSFSLL